jgi:hypothetical protein
MAILRFYKCNILPYIIIFISCGEENNDLAVVEKKRTRFLDIVRLWKMTVSFEENNRMCRAAFLKAKKKSSGKKMCTCANES